MDNAQEKQKVEQKVEQKFDISEGETKDYMVPSPENFSKDAANMLEQSRENVSYHNVAELLEGIDVNIDLLDNMLDNLVDQTEEQILTLKSSVLAVDHILPDDKLKNSRVMLMNTSRDRFLQAFADPDGLAQTVIGRSIRGSNLHADLANCDCIHGVFPLFPLGSADAKESEEHYRSLINLARFAHRNTFHVYFEVDIPRIAYRLSEEGKIRPLEKYSQLLDRHRDIHQWLNDYQVSPFYRKFNQQAAPKWMRRITALFNPYLGGTETVESYYRRKGEPTEEYTNLLDRTPWISPVAFMAQRLVANYELLGWCGGLFGLKNSARQIADYHNPKPKFRHNGLSFSRDMGYRYGLSLYNFLSEGEGQRIIELGLTPLQRQIRNGQEEWLALAEAQTLLPQPENFDDKMTPEMFKALSRLKQQEFLDKAQQKMYNYLGNCLLEDTICRGIMLLCQKFVGIVGAKNKTQEDLRDAIKDYMTIFAGHPGFRDVEPYSTYEPAVEHYEIKECEIYGSTAYATVKVRPVKVLRKFVLFIDMDPLEFEIEAKIEPKNK